MMGSLRSDLDFCGETLLNLCLTLWHNLYKRLKLLSACMLVLIAIIIILRINNCVVVVKRWGSWISLLRIEFAKVSFKWFTIKCMITFVSLAYWMCEKAHQEEKKHSKSLQWWLLRSFKEVWMCEYFQATTLNCQVVPLVIPVRFECSPRSVSVYGACGESIWAVRGSRLFISEQARGETGFMGDLRGNRVDGFQRSG